MILTRFLEWSVSLRTQRFPGRFLLGRVYRILLFSVMDTVLQFMYRLCIALKTRSREPFGFSDYRLLKEVRSHFPAPYLFRKWVHSLSRQQGAVGYRELIAQIHATKFRTPKVSWLLPETALLAPALDCKGFAVLFSSLLNAAGIKNELWIGLPSDGRGGHAWVVVETMQRRVAVDQFNGNGSDERLFLINHPYSISLKI